jgi:hypothetical protein
MATQQRESPQIRWASAGVRLQSWLFSFWGLRRGVAQPPGSLPGQEHAAALVASAQVLNRRALLFEISIVKPDHRSVGQSGVVAAPFKQQGHFTVEPRGATNPVKFRVKSPQTGHFSLLFGCQPRGDDGRSLFFPPSGGRAAIWQSFRAKKKKDRAKNDVSQAPCRSAACCCTETPLARSAARAGTCRRCRLTPGPSCSPVPAARFLVRNPLTLACISTQQRREHPRRVAPLSRGVYLVIPGVPKGAKMASVLTQ